MNSNFDPNERLLKEGRASRYGVGLFGASVATGKLIVTNHRLIFKHLFQGVAYPLAHVIRITEQRFGLAPIVQLDFDNGGVEQFGVFRAAEWIGIIEQAKANAPLLPYATHPSPSSKATRTNGWLIAVAFGLISLCGCMIFMMLIVFASMRLR